jgi:hypothetical protein
MNGRRPIDESHERQDAVVPAIRGASLMSLQVVGFSPVITIFHDFSAFFTPFLSCKGLIFRRLRKNEGLIESNPENAQSKMLKILRIREVLKGGRWNLNLANLCRL